MARPRLGKKRRGGFMMKLVIAGSRHFDDYSKLVSVVDGVLERLGVSVRDVILVCGVVRVGLMCWLCGLQRLEDGV